MGQIPTVVGVGSGNLGAGEPGSGDEKGDLKRSGPVGNVLTPGPDSLEHRVLCWTYGRVAPDRIGQEVSFPHPGYSIWWADSSREAPTSVLGDDRVWAWFRGLRGCRCGPQAVEGVPAEHCLSVLCRVAPT